MTGRLAVALTLLLVAAAPSFAQPNPMAWEQAMSDLRSSMQDWAENYGSLVDEAMGPLSGAHALATQMTDAVQTVFEGYDALSDLDRELDGAMDEPEANAPPVPVSCLGREGCEACFGSAYLQLARSRLLLLRARAIFDATHRFATAAQALGDNLAPSTREAAFVWQMQKPRIAESLGAFDQSFDRKIADMLAVVRRTLQELGECEGRYYSNPDWYQRYGFVYFEFLQSRYTRG
jgi:hypothetical protein